MPDPSAGLRELVVAGDAVVNGGSGGAEGAGRAIAVAATDLLPLADGRITDDRHTESLVARTGIATPVPP